MSFTREALQAHFNEALALVSPLQLSFPSRQIAEIYDRLKPKMEQLDSDSAMERVSRLMAHNAVWEEVEHIRESTHSVVEKTSPELAATATGSAATQAESLMHEVDDLMVSGPAAEMRAIDMLKRGIAESAQAVLRLQNAAKASGITLPR